MKKIKLSGFTLIEVLMALMILAMSVVLILGIITNIQRLRNTAYSKTISTMLAKEGMELFYNNRDSNLMSGGRDLPWNCIKTEDDGSCGGYLSLGKYTISIKSDGKGYEILPLGAGDGKLYICETNGLNIYTNINNTCKASDFKRYINISSYPGSNNIYTINSIVEYNKNGFTGEVNLQSTIGDI